MNSEFAEKISNLSLHGLPRIFLSKSLISKILWFILSLFCYTYCAYSIISNIVDFMKYDVVTNYLTYYESQPVFPAFIFITKSDGRIDCKFNNKECVIRELYNNSNLYSFNLILNETKEFLKSKQTGIEFGLNLKIQTSEDIQLFIINNTASYVNSNIRISPGMITNLVVKRSFEERLGPPFSNCQKSVTLKNGVEIPYKQNECFYLCTLRMYAEDCDKKEWYLKNFERFYNLNNEMSFINFHLRSVPEVFSSCSNSSGLHNFVSLLSEGVNTACEEECPDECQSNLLEVTPFYRLFRSKNKSDMAELNIYYDSFYYTIVEQMPKVTEEQLFGTIGGLMGLFFGASILSLFELFGLGFSIISLANKKSYQINKVRDQAKESIDQKIESNN